MSLTKLLPVILLMMATGVQASTRDEIERLWHPQGMAAQPAQPAADTPARTDKTEKPAPRWFRLSNGRQVNLADWKVVLFMQGHCPYCHQFDPVLKQLAQQYGFSADKTEKPAPRWFRLSNGRQVNLADWKVVLFMQGHCPYCHQFDPVLKQLAQQYGFSVFPYTLDGQGDTAFPEACLSNGRQVNRADWKVVLFMQGHCPYCHQFDPVLKQLAQQYGFSVFPYTLDGQGDMAFPEALPVPPDVMQTFFPNIPVATPTTFLVNVNTLEALPLLQGATDAAGFMEGGAVYAGALPLLSPV